MVSAGFWLLYNTDFARNIFLEKWVVLIVYYIWYETFIESYYFICI